MPLGRRILQGVKEKKNTLVKRSEKDNKDSRRQKMKIVVVGKQEIGRVLYR